MERLFGSRSVRGMMEIQKGVIGSGIQSARNFGETQDMLSVTRLISKLHRDGLETQSLESSSSYNPMYQCNAG